MPNYFKNIITPDFYDFLSSNKRAYGSAVLDQLNDSAEKISLSTEEDESLAIVLNGATSNLASKDSYIENDVEHVVFETDGILRKKIKFRCIEAQTYAQNNVNFTGHLLDPFEDGISEEEAQYRVALHPSAYSVMAEFEEKPLSFGTLVIIKKISDTYFIVSTVAESAGGSFGGVAFAGGSRNLHNSGNAAADQLAAKHGLTRRTGQYTGMLAQFRGIKLFNGTLPKEMLRVPDTTYWQSHGSGDGSVLVDYVDSFNAMAKAFHAHFGHKLRSSGIRSFKQQVINRQYGINKGSCADMHSSCGTAVPGSSNHGWGQAVDIRKPVNKECTGDACFIGFDKYHNWLLDNAYKKGFNGLKWGWLGQKGTVLSTKKLKEPWHWEPINNRVIKVD